MFGADMNCCLLGRSGNSKPGSGRGGGGGGITGWVVVGGGGEVESM